MIRLIKEIDGQSVLIMCRPAQAELMKSEGFELAGAETPAHLCDHTSMFTAINGELVQFVAPVDCMKALITDLDASTTPKAARLAIEEAQIKSDSAKKAKAAKAREAKAAKAKAKKESGE